jgi:hypothetical protein
MINTIMNLITWALGAVIVLSLGYVGYAMYSDIIVDLPRMKTECSERGGELVTVHARRLCFRKDVIIHDIAQP